MSIAEDLGQIGDLATALGLLDSTGQPNGAWFSAPASTMRSCISNPGQREALLRFVNEVIGGDAATTDARGRTWLPIVEHTAPDVTVSIVVDAAPANLVVLGIGATLTSAADASPGFDVRVHIPVVAVTKDGTARPNGPLLPGTAEGVIELSADLSFVPPAPGAAGIAGAGLTATIPTAEHVDAAIGLVLRGLQLPGAGAAQDLIIDLSHPENLGATVRDLLLELARREAASPGPVRGLAEMLGLVAGAVPEFPLDQLAAQGAQVLAGWLSAIAADNTARAQWLVGLAELLGLPASDVDHATGDVVLTLGVATVRLGIRSVPGPAGHPVLSLVVSAIVSSAEVDARAVVELVSVDLGTGRAVAVPTLEVAARAGERVDPGGSTGTPLISAGDVQVGGFRVGFSLDPNRRPALLLAADNVSILGHPYPTLDLSSPDAIAATVAHTLDSVVADLLTQLAGGLGDAVGLLLGVRAPPSDPGLTTLDLAAFVRDPVAALAAYWTTLIASPAGILDVLTVLRGLLGDAGALADPVHGTGSETDPWVLPVVGPVRLAAWRPDGHPGELVVGVTAAFTLASLGHGCTSIDTTFTVLLADLDLAGRRASLLPGARAALTLTATGSPEMGLDLGGVLLQADSVGLHLGWLAGAPGPTTGLRVGFAAPGLALVVDGETIPVPLPEIAADGTVTLPAAAWTSLEAALAVLARHSPAWWLGGLTSLLGWGANATGPHLSLAELVVSPEQALGDWANGLAAPVGATVPHALVSFLARLAGGPRGDYGVYAGSGTPADPFVIPLTGNDPTSAPALTLRWGPYGPWPVPVSGAPDAVQSWRPGRPGLDAAGLAAAITLEASADPGLADLLTGRPDVRAGLEAIATRIRGSDGLVVPPVAPPAGVTVTTLAATAADLGTAVDLETLLGDLAPVLVVHVGVPGSAAGTQPPPAVAGQLVDATAPGVPVTSIALPAFSAGTWWVSLGSRADCRLASGDPDGVAGQAARLAAIVTAAAAAAGAGDVVLVGWGAAGHPVARVAADVAAVTRAVLVGTPLTAVTANVIDTDPAADTLRLLAALLPPAADSEAVPDPDTEPDDADLAAGRGVVATFMALAELADPVGELALPAGSTSPLPDGIGRAGLAVDAVFGSLESADVDRLLTAVVAAGLAARARHRTGGRGAPAELRVGMRAVLPVAALGPAVVAGGSVDVDLFSLVRGAAATPPQLVASPRLRARLGIGAARGWLVGGPGADRSAATVRETDLRRAEIVLDVPLFAGSAATDDVAALVLHEVRVGQLRRTRWTLSRDQASAIAADAAGAYEIGASTVSASISSTLLPEARIALGRLAERLEDPAAGSIAGWLVELLQAARLLDTTGGFVAESVERLLGDPLAHLRDLRGDPTAAAALARALERLSGAATAPGTGTTAHLVWGSVALGVDLAGQSVSLDVAETAGRGSVTWTLSAALGASGPTLTVGLGASAPPGGPAGGLRMELALPQPRLGLVWTHGSSADHLALWPAPDGAELARAAARMLAAEAARAALEAVRRLDATAQPVIDAALDAIGLLAPGIGLDRAVRLPAVLFTDPAGFFRHPDVLGGAGGVDGGRVIALLDGVRPLLGIPGGPGEWQLATGVTVRAAPVGAAVRLGLQLDASAFAAPPAPADRLSLLLDVGLLLGAGTPGVDVDIAVGVAGAAAGRSAVHLELGTAGIRLYARPAMGADLVLYPGGAGLAGLAQQAVTRALPMVLDELAGLTGAGLPTTVASVVSELGDAFALRTAGHFDPGALSRWGADPLAALNAAWPSAAAAGLAQVAAALGSLIGTLPGAPVISHDGTGISVAMAGVTVALHVPLALQVSVTRPLVPVVGTVTALVRVDATGPLEVTAVLGPAALDIGGITLAPLIGVHAGSAPDHGRRVEVGLDLGGGRALIAQCLLGSAPHFALVARDGGTDKTDDASVALAAVEAVLDVAASVVLALPDVATLLDQHLGGVPAHPTIRTLLSGSLLSDDGLHAATGLADPALLLSRALTLAKHLASEKPSITVGGLTISLDAQGGKYGVRVDLAAPLTLVQGSPTIRLETDVSWIDTTGGAIDGGITLWLLADAVAPPLNLALQPALTIGGVGVRILGDQAPLLDAGLRIDSIAVHGYLDVEPGSLSGGAQLELAGLAIGVGGASGGNPVAHGLLADTGSGNQALRPSFSPAIAVQRHGTGDVMVSLRAGPGDGPWWLVIQRGFGPIYIEQVGLAVTVTEGQINKIGVLLDGRVSILGLTAAVDDLQVAFVLGGGSAFSSSSWQVDLAGLAISAEIAGLSLQGGLRKFSDPTGVQYVGMLLGRFAAYGISVYGGYGRTTDDQGTYASFFAFGAVNGPIGGVPAFFVTGIGGGLGINRMLIVPTDLSNFGDYPLIKALDPGARPSPDPMADLTRVAGYFPARRGSFWFAAGISFNSFALVDGVAVLAIQVGDGLEIDLLGLARMALPRPQFAIISIEVALVVRFSTEEGVLWVQAQLTDNSWLLYPDVRLTGGFAFVIWFSGPHRGESVFTLGGYHPDYHRDGYPQVPRLGFQWQWSIFSIKGGSYFALTSDAAMAGASLEASADFGIASVSATLSADGIVYYDPLHFNVVVAASISGSVDLWLCTVSVSVTARITVEGPKFHGVAEVDLGPTSVSVEFGDPGQEAWRLLGWAEFVTKYLEQGPTGAARALAGIAGRGSQPGSVTGGSQAPTPDGSLAQPYLVTAEFELLVTSTIPMTTVQVRGTGVATIPGDGLGIAPMGRSSLPSLLNLTMTEITSGRTRADVPELSAMGISAPEGARYPPGVWGLAKAQDDPPLPTGDTVGGLDHVTVTAEAVEGHGLGPYAYDKVETGAHLPLPFGFERVFRTPFLADAAALTDLLPAPGAGAAALFDQARSWLARSSPSRTFLQSYSGSRVAPPRLGALSDRLTPDELPVPTVNDVVPGPVAVDRTLRPPLVTALLSAPRLLARTPLRTTVATAPDGTPRISPPTMASATTRTPIALAARLVRVPAAATASPTGLIATGSAPATGGVGPGTESLTRVGSAVDGAVRLTALSSTIARAPKQAGQRLRVGEVAVLRMPSVAVDDASRGRPSLAVSGAACRVVALGAGGGVLDDAAFAADGTFTVPVRTERVVLAATGSPLTSRTATGAFAPAAAAPGLLGWHSGQSLPYVGWSTLLAAGAVVSVEGGVARRAGRTVSAGFVPVSTVVTGDRLVRTRFAAAVACVVVVIDAANVAGAVPDGLVTGLDGAQRAHDALGAVVPPTLVVSGGRSHLVYDVVSAGPVTVTIGSDPRWALAGVLASTQPVPDVVRLLVRVGLEDALGAPVVAGADGTVQVTWVTPDGSAAPVPKRRKAVPPPKSVRTRRR